MSAPSAAPASAGPSVLFINRVYPPVGGATGALLSELAADLVAAGWTVGVLTGPAPDAPPHTVTADGVHVYRVPGLGVSRTSTVRRALAYLSLYPVLWGRALRLRAYDVVVTKTDPPMQAVLGPLIQAWTGQPLVHWAQDLYPEIAEALGVIRDGGPVARLMRRLSTWALRRHDRTVAVGRCMKARIEARGVEAEAIAVAPNWPPDTVHPVPHADNAFRAAHDLDGQFVVMYSGNMGMAHTFKAVLDAAEHLRDRPDIVFLFVGDGPRKASVHTAAEERGLSNVRFLPFQPFDVLAESLSAGDLHLVTMGPGTEGLVVPSKLYGALAAGRPAIFVGDPASEAARHLDEHDCGTVLSEPSGATVAQAIVTWKDHPRRRKEARRRAVASVDSLRADAVAVFQEAIRQCL